MDSAHISNPPSQASVIVARRNALTTWSWAMVPLALFVTFPIAFVVIAVLLGVRDLEGSEPMSEQGLYGWFVLLLGTCILVSPQALGVLLARRARRLGAGWGARAALVVNALCLVGLPIAIVVQSLQQ